MANAEKTPEFLLLHRRTFKRLVRSADRGRVMQVYDEAVKELTDRAIFAAKRTGEMSFTAHTNRIVLTQLEDGLREFAREFGNAVASESHTAVLEGARSAVSTVAEGMRLYPGVAPIVPVEQALRFIGATAGTKQSLMRSHDRTVRRLSAEVVTQIEKQMAVSLLTGETTFQATERIATAGKLVRWQAERIARTEQAWSFSASASDVIVQAQPRIPGLYLRWVEYVDDFTGRALDNRVAADSLAMHGQLRNEAGLFTLPPHPRVKATRWGMTFPFSPARPNDRSHIEPWQSHYGIPAWFWTGSDRVDATEFLRRRMTAETALRL